MQLAPAPPRAPCPLAHELVLKYQGKERTMLIIGVAFLVMGSLFTLIFGRGTLTDLHITLRGVEGTGYVTETRLETSMEKNGQHPLRIDFTYVDGGTHNGSSFTTKGQLIQAAVVGSMLPVEYIPGSPGAARIAGTGIAPFGMVGAIPLIFPLLGAWLTFQAVRANRRQSDAYRHGRATRGLVISRGEDTTVSSNEKHPMRIRWEFHVDGVRYEGELSHFDHALILRAFPADEVIVLYDPRFPGTTNTIFIDS